VVTKGAGLSDCNARPKQRRGVTSDRSNRASGSNPAPVSHLRSDPSTLAARQPDPFAGARKRRQPWLTQTVVPVLQTGDTPPRRRHWGARALASRRGARNNRERGKRSSKPVPCPSLGGARPMLPGEAIHRAPSLHRGGALPGASVLASKEATPPQGVRGEGRQTAWLLGVISRPDPNAGRARPGRWLATARYEQSSRRMETSAAGERGGGPLARGVGLFGASREPRTRTEAGASRGEGFTARGRARASIMRCRYR